MSRGNYHLVRGGTGGRSRKLLIACSVILGLIIIGVIYKQLSTGGGVSILPVNGLQYDSTVTAAEKKTIQQAIDTQKLGVKGKVTVSVKTGLDAATPQSVVAVYVPVTNMYASRQTVNAADLPNLSLFIPANTDSAVKASLATALNVPATSLKSLEGSLEDIADTDIAFVPAGQVTTAVKLLSLDGAYYLDSFTKGGVFRQVSLTGGNAKALSAASFNSLPTKETTLKVNMTGVTALTRLMQRKLPSVKDATYFSEKIGPFLADADITHVSNEVSFKPGCEYSSAVFCSPPEMLTALQSSGVDLVELTGNHNNDTGNSYNTDSIKTYQSLGINTFGGGLNATEAAKPFVSTAKKSKVSFLGYNYADGPNSGAIAGATTAGANSFNYDKIKADIAAAKQESSFVIVDVQFWECQAYPAGYVEFPECDLPITDQKEVFRKLVDLGADMVIGTQAHQPQIFEFYNGKPIYYGLGNLFFEQIQWPGTERGIILTHYFKDGKLLQTKLSPTMYDRDLQTKLLPNDEATQFLERLKQSRESANL